MKVYIKHIAACFSSPISRRASNLNNWWQRVVRGGTSDYNTAICYSSLSRCCSVLLLFSELVHQSWNRILHFINPAEGSFQPHHSAPLMSEDFLMYSFKPSNPLDKICKGGIYQGWTPRPAGNPPRGEGGVPRPAPRCREGGVSRPAPRCGEGGVPRPAPPHKNDQNGGEFAGQNKGPKLNFSNRGNQWWNNITTLNYAQSSLSIGYARERKKWKYLLILC